MVFLLLFETRFGEWLLSLLERWFGLAIVPAEWLRELQASCETV